MSKLYHYWLCPFSRKIRLILGEKKAETELIIEKPWDCRMAFLEMNPEGWPPVFIDEDGTITAGSYAISEYLDEVHFDSRLMGLNSRERAETRRLVAWFDVKFFNEVTRNLLYEKHFKRRMGEGLPDTTAIRAGHAHIHDHLEYIEWLVNRRYWLAGETLSMADLTAAAHLSCLDYLGDVPWDKHPVAKEWYARLKCRPSFRPLLQDSVPALQPAAHYTDLDF